MPNGRRLRRNDVVIERNNRGWAFYGRVWKRLDESRVVVIDCGKRVTIYDEGDLILSSYKGDYEYQNPSRFRYMPNLRKLKKMAKWYNPNLRAFEYDPTR